MVEKSFPIGLADLIQYRSVTASQPATHPASQPPSHVAVAITLNALAKASSLKIMVPIYVRNEIFKTIKISLLEIIMILFIGTV